MPFNRTDISLAYWCFAWFICGRLGSYAVYTWLDDVRYGSPRPALYERPKNLTKNGKRVYMKLVRDYYG